MSSKQSRKQNFSRRRFLRDTGLLVGTALTYSAMPRLAMAYPADPPTSALVKRVVRSPANTYFTYPHSNGFLPDGTPVLASPTGNNGTDIDFIACNPNSSDSAKKIAHVTKTRMYYSMSTNGLMVTSKTDGSVAVLDMTIKGAVGKDITPRQIFHEDGLVIAADNDISMDGKRALITCTRYDADKQPIDGLMNVIDINTGEVKNIIKNWQVDHAHFSPFDQSWICFCDNRSNNLDRMWVWNETQAPKGQHLFEQTYPDGHYTVGHERAMFHKPALLTIAYTYTGKERMPGLFEVGFDGSVRLISASRRDFHCNISRDGRWAVVSLQGVYDPNDAKPDGNWLKELGTGYGYSDVMFVNMRTGARQFFYRGTNATTGQPYEVQPTISPDGRWILLKDAREQRVLMVEINQDALASFLAMS